MENWELRSDPVALNRLLTPQGPVSDKRVYQMDEKAGLRRMRYAPNDDALKAQWKGDRLMKKNSTVATTETRFSTSPS